MSYLILNQAPRLSVGEIACAYLDGTFTLEEAVLVAHARAKAAATCPQGVMVSVGALPYPTASLRCTPFKC